VRKSSFEKLRCEELVVITAIMEQIYNFDCVNNLVDDYMWDYELGYKLVVVLRGLPGSGKTTFARQLAAYARENGIASGICSADDYFVNSAGQYHFCRLLLQTAHYHCREKFYLMLGSDPRNDPHGVSLIIVDNTNITTSEYRDYKRNALRYDRFMTIRFECRDEAEAARQGERSVHQVERETVIRRFRDFERLEDDYVVDPIYTDEEW
jgi:tRNA uridine 5-carbamoylmethylation protein Kti12